MTLKELFIKRNNRMNDFRLNYYATVLVVSGYLTIAGDSWVLPICIFSYLMLRRYVDFNSESILEYFKVDILTYSESEKLLERTCELSERDEDDLKAYLTEEFRLRDKKISILMDLELVLVCLIIFYTNNILK